MKGALMTTTTNLEGIPMMKKMMMAAALATGLGAAPAFADGHANSVTLQLQWVTQAQFAGYYVALDKGFYEEEGLDVKILAGGPDIAPPQVLAGGGADAMLNWMPSALAAREKGLPVVNIAQPFKSSGLMLTCWKDTGITGPQDFKGKTIGVWFFGNEYPFLSWMSQVGIPTDGGEDGVTVLKQGFNVDPLLQRQADCISTMTYNEYGQVLDAGVSPDELVTFKYEDQGVATLEDGIYALEENLEDPVFVDKMVRFVRASMKGWKWAEENPEDAAMIVLDNDETGAQTEAAQVRMMGEIAKLTAGSDGSLDPADYQRTVDTLLAGGSDPVISAAPEGAWTSAITDAALN
jgi:NitT/TauT family transport system substrate-binding protein